MPPDPAPDPLDPWVRALIRTKARRLARRPGLHPQDRPDLEADLFAHVLRQLRKYDPARAAVRAFLVRVVERAAINLLRVRRAAKRDPRRTRSLEAPGPHGEPLAASHLLERWHHRRLGTAPRPDQERAELRLDLEALLARLPPALRETAADLMRWTPAEVARRRGLARATVYRRRAQLRHFFGRAGW